MLGSPVARVMFLLLGHLIPMWESQPGYPGMGWHHPLLQQSWAPLPRALTTPEPPALCNRTPKGVLGKPHPPAGKRGSPVLVIRVLLHLGAGWGPKLVRQMESPPRSLPVLVYRVSLEMCRRLFQLPGKARSFTFPPTPQIPVPMRAAKPK